MATATKLRTGIDEFLADVEKLVRECPEVQVTLCATYVSPGVKVDAGGFVIVGGHVVKVPGWQPDGPEFAKAKIAMTSAAFTIASLIPAGERREVVEKAVAGSLRA
jgi:hypothetical protein